MTRYEYVNSLSKAENSLEHHGIIGQKWGVRRYQNSDGTLTIEGRKHLELNDTQKNIAKSAGVMASISVAQTIVNYKNAQRALDAMGFGDKILMSEVVSKGAVAAGKAAVIGSLGYIGYKAAKNIIETNHNDPNSSNK